ncbi:MAG: helix-turn-helix domain-containing protein [Mucilaginibacter polytrichastri]|nr:helix-turn-helix domain-containing protein [Mucilaginibacter polytrichastri]
MSSNIKIAKICEFCGNRFIAKTTVTRFCSHKCNSRNYKQKGREKKFAEAKQLLHRQISHQLEELRYFEFLSVKAAAKLLGSSTKIIYGMIRSGKLKATNLSIRKTVVSRVELDRLFELPEISDSDNPNSSNLSQCCHMGEAQKLYNISEKALFDIIQRNQISKYRIGQYTYVLKSQLEQVFFPGGIHV